MKVVCCLGTRPEVIKLAPVIQEINSRSTLFKGVVVSTGQHRQMLDQALSVFGLHTDIDLQLMEPNQTLAELTSRLILKLDSVFHKEAPDWVLAQGDTTSVMASALVCFYRKIRFGHVEAGLRTGDYENPFPEEMNRRIADLAASAYFAPTPNSAQALRKEGISNSKIHVTGNTVVDALKWIVKSGKCPDPYCGLGLPKNSELVLITAHRRESFGSQFREMCLALRELANLYTKVQFVYPVHLNPNVQQPVREILGGKSNFHLVEPFDYAELVGLMRSSRLILTDSGGIQEEAPTFGVPVLVMRKTTERPEGVEAGAVQLVGTDRVRIVRAAQALLSKPFLPWKGKNPYGDGKAAERIVRVLEKSGN